MSDRRRRWHQMVTEAARREGYRWVQHPHARNGVKFIVPLENEAGRTWERVGYQWKQLNGRSPGQRTDLR